MAFNLYDAVDQTLEFIRDVTKSAPTDDYLEYLTSLMEELASHVEEMTEDDEDEDEEDDIDEDDDDFDDEDDEFDDLDDEDDFIEEIKPSSTQTTTATDLSNGGKKETSH